MATDSTFTPPATFTRTSTFWRLQSDGRVLWVDDDGVARDAIGLVVPITEVLRDGTRVKESDFRMALVCQDRSSPMRLPSGEHLGGRRLQLAHYSIPPVIARGDPPWASRSIRILPVLDQTGVHVGEIWFAWKAGAWHLEHSGFNAGFQQRLRFDDCGRLTLAAKEHDWATLDAFHPRALPWYCSACGRNYPEELWRLFEHPQVNDGCAAILGHTYHGTCPYGHARLLAERPQRQLGRS